MPSPPHIWLNYRPVRIGWLIPDRDIAKIATVAIWNSCLWGGVFNPIIPIHSAPLSERLVRIFGVDLLIPVEGNDTTNLFVERFPHLHMQRWQEKIFHERNCEFADIRHAIRRMLARQDREAASKLVLPTWDGADPLGTLFSLLFGGYPEPSDAVPDYRRGIRSETAVPEVAIPSGEPVPLEISERISPVALTAYDLTHFLDFRGWLKPAIVLGSSQDFDDLVLAWNLRAAGAPLCFFDSENAERLKPFVNRFIAAFRQNALGPRAALNFWKRAAPPTDDSWRPDLEFEGIPVGLCDGRGDELWNRMNIELARPRFSVWHRDVVPSYTESDGEARASFALPDRPFDDDDTHTLRQKFVVEVDAKQYSISPDAELTFETPFVPQLNEFYGRNFYHDYDATRAEIGNMDGGCVGIITDISTQRIAISAYRVFDWMKQLFSHCRIGIERSEPGLRCSRVIAQLGGVQDCRVFKIRGVRNLLEKYGVNQSFTRSGAIAAIRNVSPDQVVGFDAFKTLYIEPRERGDLTPDAVLTYLLSRRVFRAGLELKCPNCELISWVHLDDVRTRSTCPYCDQVYDVTGQLRDRDWRYRRSGIFGRDDHQLGGIPVALTLQQLSSSLHERLMMYSTALHFLPKGADVESCESDFVAIVSGAKGISESPLQILLGEAKTHKAIDAEDVRKLGKLADAIPQELAQTFIMFSKTGTFSAGEVALAQGLNTRYRQRVILWSREELEPFYAYERSKTSLGGRQYATTLTDMARVTHSLFFERPAEGLAAPR